MTRPLVPYTEASRLLFNIPVIRLASRLSTLVQRDVLEPSGLKTAEWRILFNLVVTGDTHLRQIARYSSTDASYVSRILARLEKEGLVRRYADMRDARRTRFAATEKGQALIDALLPEVTELSDGFRSLFTDEELLLFQSMLERAIDHANDLIEAPAP